MAITRGGKGSPLTNDELDATLVAALGSGWGVRRKFTYDNDGRTNKKPGTFTCFLEGGWAARYEFYFNDSDDGHDFMRALFFGVQLGTRNTEYFIEKNGGNFSRQFYGYGAMLDHNMTSTDSGAVSDWIETQLGSDLAKGSYYLVESSDHKTITFVSNTFWTNIPIKPKDNLVGDIWIEVDPYRSCSGAFVNKDLFVLNGTNTDNENNVKGYFNYIVEKPLSGVTDGRFEVELRTIGEDGSGVRFNLHDLFGMDGAPSSSGDLGLLKFEQIKVGAGQMSHGTSRRDYADPEYSVRQYIVDDLDIDSSGSLAKVTLRPHPHLANRSGRRSGWRLFDRPNREHIYKLNFTPNVFDNRRPVVWEYLVPNGGNTINGLVLGGANRTVRPNMVKFDMRRISPNLGKTIVDLHGLDSAGYNEGDEVDLLFFRNQNDAIHINVYHMSSAASLGNQFIVLGSDDAYSYVYFRTKTALGFKIKKVSILGNSYWLLNTYGA